MIAPKSSEGSSNPQNGRFPCKIALRLKKVCYKVSFCENRQRQNCKAFIGLSIPVEIIGGGRPLYAKVCLKLSHHPIAKRRFSIYFRSWRLSRGRGAFISNFAVFYSETAVDYRYWVYKQKQIIHRRTDVCLPAIISQQRSTCFSLTAVDSNTIRLFLIEKDRLCKLLRTKWKIPLQ